MGRPLEGKIALVTGASRGIGCAAAKALADAGAHVIAVARTVGGLEELDDTIKAKGGAATLVPLDVTDGDGIDRLGAAIYERWGRLDVLLGNAGVLGAISPVNHIEPKVFEEVMAVNVTANFRLLRSFDPLLRQSTAGRALFMTSGAARNLRPFWSAYSMSKAALEAMVVTYARETDHSSIKTVLINPGPIKTHMRAKAVPGEDPSTLPTPSDLALDIVKLADDSLTKSCVIWDYPTQAFIDL